MRSFISIAALAASLCAVPAQASITLQEKVYFGTAWQLLDRPAPDVPIPSGNGFVNQHVIRALDGTFYGGTVERRDGNGTVTDVLLVFAGAEHLDVVPAEIMGYTGIPSAEAVQAAERYRDLIANPAYANAKIHVMGHSMGAGFTEYVAAWSVKNLGAQVTADRADFTGFGVPPWQGVILQYFGMPANALDGVFVGYTAANDPTRGKGGVQLGAIGVWSGIEYTLPAYFGSPGPLGLGAALDPFGAHSPTTFMAALGQPAWMDAATGQAVNNVVAANFGFPTYSTAYNFPGGAPLIVDGDSAADDLGGLGGADIITGGAGADTMAGGGGADRFVYRAVGDSGITTTTVDRITDFSAVQGDRIDLSAIDARPDIAGRQAFSFVPTSGFNAPGQVTSWSDGTATWVAINTDSNPAPDMVIRLDGNTVLGASAFVL